MSQKLNQNNEAKLIDIVSKIIERNDKKKINIPLIASQTNLKQQGRNFVQSLIAVGKYFTSTPCIHTSKHSFSPSTFTFRSQKNTRKEKSAQK